MTASTRDATTTGLLPLLADLACVLAFAVAGTESHEAGASSWVALAVVWPFAVAVLLGHAGVARANLARDRIWPGGVVVVAATYLLGMALRVVSGRGLAVAFLVVALLFLVATMLGWRAVRAAVAGRRSRS